MTRDTRGVYIQNVTCDDASSNCYAGYLDQGLVFVDNHMNSAVYPEFASQVDTTAIGNRMNQAGSDLYGLVAPQTGGLLIDFGTGFSTFDGNTIGDNLQACSARRFESHVHRKPEIGSTRMIMICVIDPPTNS